MEARADWVLKTLAFVTMKVDYEDSFLEMNRGK